MLQKSSLRGCRIKICNNRIGANGFLNQRCALTPDLESILRAWTGKIVLQHNRLVAASMPLMTYSITGGRIAFGRNVTRDAFPIGRCCRNRADRVSVGHHDPPESW